MTTAWEGVWARRSVDEAAPTTLTGMMRADGLDTGFGSVSEANWRAGVRRVADELHLAAGDSVYEVGCGAGAFLYELYEHGVRVAGLDRSEALVQCARRMLPGGCFTVGDAAELDVLDPVDAVVSFGVFMYFPSLGYARGVIERMAGKARRCVALLDIPDLERKDAAMAARVELAGGAAAYAERYAGLEHLYFERSWMAGVLDACGLVDVQVVDQWIAGYPNAAYRFNAWGFVPRSARAPGGTGPD